MGHISLFFLSANCGEFRGVGGGFPCSVRYSASVENRFERGVSRDMPPERARALVRAHWLSAQASERHAELERAPSRIRERRVMGRLSQQGEHGHSARRGT